MTLKLRIIILAVLLIGFIVVVSMIRRRSLELKYALTWFVLGVSLVVAVSVPGLLEDVSEMLGIYNPMNMVFFIGFALSIIVIFALTIALSRNSNRVRKMAQKIALNEYRSNKNSQKL